MDKYTEHLESEMLDIQRREYRDEIRAEIDYWENQLEEDCFYQFHNIKRRIVHICQTKEKAKQYLKDIKHIEEWEFSPLELFDGALHPVNTLFFDK